MVATALARDAEQVGVRRLAELPVRPDDDRVVPREVAEARSAFLRTRSRGRRVVQPDPLAAPAQAVALALTRREVVTASFGLIGALDGCAAREGGELQAI